MQNVLFGSFTCNWPLSCNEIRNEHEQRKHNSFLTSPDPLPLHDQHVAEKLCTTINPAYMDVDLYIYKVWIHPASSIMTSLEGRRELPLYCSDTTTHYTTMCHRDSLSLSCCLCFPAFTSLLLIVSCFPSILAFFLSFIFLAYPSPPFLCLPTDLLLSVW